jgi:biotin/methionine sulfoxide reductase
MGRNPTGSAIPVARIVDMLLHPGEEYEFNGGRYRYPETKMIYWAGGNPFHHHQDINRLIDGWSRPDTIVVHEPWWTATARFADIVLPATTSLERNDIGAASRDPFLVAMHQAVPPAGAARSDYEIFTARARLLGCEEAFTEGRDEMGWVRHLYEGARADARSHGVELPLFESFWEQGSVEVWGPEDKVPLSDFRADPSAHPLATPSGRIEIFSDVVAGFGYEECPGHATWIAPEEWLGATSAERFPLHLVSNQPATRLHSQLDMARVSQGSKIQGREPCRLNPRDAARRGIGDGDVVRIFNDRGSCLAGARVSEAIRPGVVQLATGAWYDPLESGVIGTLDVHGNPNVLTADRGTSRLAQGPSAHSALVEVERYDGPLPAVSVFEAPDVRPRLSPPD